MRRNWLAVLVGCAVMATVGACSDMNVGALLPDAGTPRDAGSPGPRAELCGNGMDDDRNGRIDDGCPCAPGEVQSCFGGDYPSRHVGLCRDGMQVCDVREGVEWGDWGDFACSGDVRPAEEQCDGMDHDCDGMRNEGCPCTEGQTQVCGGEFPMNLPCMAGNQRCQSDGTWGTVCEGAVGPSAEVCGNGIDDDCDGDADPSRLCMCSPVPEICGNGVDDDCDGVVDEPGACVVCSPRAEVCGDGIDQDCDGRDARCPVDAGPGAPDACTPLTCEGRCGSVADGCGGLLTCAACGGCEGPATLERFVGVGSRLLRIDRVDDEIFVSRFDEDGAPARFGIDRIDVRGRTTIPAGFMDEAFGLEFTRARRLYWLSGASVVGPRLFVASETADDWAGVTGSETWFSHQSAGLSADLQGERALVQPVGGALMVLDLTEFSRRPVMGVMAASKWAPRGEGWVVASRTGSSGYRLYEIGSGEAAREAHHSTTDAPLSLVVSENDEIVWAEGDPLRSAEPARVMVLPPGASVPTVLFDDHVGIVHAASERWIYFEIIPGNGLLARRFARRSRATGSIEVLHEAGVTHPNSEQTSHVAGASPVVVHDGCAFVIVTSDPGRFSYVAWIAD